MSHPIHARLLGFNADTYSGLWIQIGGFYLLDQPLLAHSITLLAATLCGAVFVGLVYAMQPMLARDQGSRPVGSNLELAHSTDELASLIGYSPHIRV